MDQLEGMRKDDVPERVEFEDLTAACVFLNDSRPLGWLERSEDGPGGTICCSAGFGGKTLSFELPGRGLATWVVNVPDSCKSRDVGAPRFGREDAGKDVEVSVEPKGRGYLMIVGIDLILLSSSFKTTVAAAGLSSG